MIISPMIRYYETLLIRFYHGQSTGARCPDRRAVFPRAGVHALGVEWHIVLQVQQPKDGNFLGIVGIGDWSTGTHHLLREIQRNPVVPNDRRPRWAMNAKNEVPKLVLESKKVQEHSRIY